MSRIVELIETPSSRQAGVDSQEQKMKWYRVALAVGVFVTLLGLGLGVVSLVSPDLVSHGMFIGTAGGCIAFGAVGLVVAVAMGVSFYLKSNEQVNVSAIDESSSSEEELLIPDESSSSEEELLIPDESSSSEEEL